MAKKDMDGGLLEMNGEGRIEVLGTWTHVREFMKQPVPVALSLYLIEVR